MITGRTPEGLGYAVKRRDGNVAYCSLSIACGTRAEGELPEGTAHFVEHAIFRGTESLSATRINSCLDRLGGDLNAFTAKEEIVIHATVLKEDIAKAAGLLMKLATEATFPEREIETERGVILDEIISYKDSPSEDIYDNFESRFFAGSPLGRQILGTEESVRSIGRGELECFYRRHFIPSNMVLSIVAPETEEKLEGRVKALSSRFLAACSHAVPVQDTEIKRIIPARFDLSVTKNLHEANAVFGAPAPGLTDSPRKRITAILLANILGGPASNSLLGNRLREKNGWVYAIDCAYTQYRDAGLMTISLGCDKDNLKRCCKAVRQIVSDFNSSPMSGRALASAKRQLLGQLAISSEGGEAQCLSMGKSLLSLGKVTASGETRELVESITAEELLSCGRETFSPDLISTLIYI